MKFKKWKIKKNNKIKMAIFCLTTIGIGWGFIWWFNNNQINILSKLNIKNSQLFGSYPDPSSVNHDCDYGTYCIQKNAGRLYYDGQSSGIKTEDNWATYQEKFYIPGRLFATMVKFVNNNNITLDMLNLAWLEFQINIFTPCFDGVKSANKTFEWWRTTYEWIDDGNKTLGDEILMKASEKIRSPDLQFSEKKGMEIISTYYDNGSYEIFSSITIEAQ